MFFRLLIAILSVISVSVPGVALAQGKPVTLSSEVKLVRVVERTEQGEPVRTELVEPETVVPGDTLAFSISYRNAGEEPMTDVEIVNPLPANLRLNDESAVASEVSVDGGQNWGMLDALTVAQADGETRPATAGDVTHLRWKIARLTPGESGSTEFRATVR